MTTEDVESKSKTTTVAHDIRFPLAVRGHESRIVFVKSTVISTDIYYASSLRVEGTVGIVVSPGDGVPNVYYFFYNIESVFPNAEAISCIKRVSTKTNIETKVINSTDVQDLSNTNLRSLDILEYIPFYSDLPSSAVEFPDDSGIVISSDTNVSSSPSPATGAAATALDTLTIRIQFAGMTPEVPPEKRQSAMRLLIA